MRALLVTLWCAASLHCAQAAEIVVSKPEPDGPTAVFVFGEFALTDIERFRTKVADLPRSVVVFNSNGGNLRAGIEMGEIIRLKNFATFVPSGARCASSCAISWLGGTERFMEAGARIGFHAAYIVRDGQLSETGVGNAVLGAYLNKLGLPTSAVVYVTQAAPGAMTWMSSREAQQLGIEVTSFTALPRTPASAPRAPIMSGQLEDRAKSFLTGFFEFWSEAPSSNLRLLEGLYAAQVRYYGAVTPRQAVVADKRAFAERWPERKYRMRAGSLNVRCDRPASTCNLSGITDWRAKNAARNTTSNGTVNFEYSIVVKGDSFVILSENSIAPQRQSKNLN